MCVLAMAWRAHSRWQLVLAGNRDEYHDRPAAPLGRWSETAELIGGRDLRSGGTWLGISEMGRLAVVTNLRGYPAEPDRPSRGMLVTDLLAGTDPLTLPIQAYNPTNLIVVDRGAAHFLTNRPDTLCAALQPGIYGLSNAALDTPWPKTVRLKSILCDWLADAADRPELLLAGLREEKLPSTAQDPRAPVDDGAVTGPVFISHPVYGTRCSSVIAIDHDGSGLFIERRFDSAGATLGETCLPFRWPTAWCKAERC